MTSILVTGGAGFIGSHVTEELLDQGFEVILFDHAQHTREEASKRPVTTYLGDIRDSVAVTEAMAHVDGFIHLAGVLGTAETIANPTPAIMTNITGGLNVLEASNQYGIPGVNIAVGNYWEQNPYSISKNSVERLATMFAQYRGSKVTNVRALNAYGPGQSVAAPFGTSKVRKIVPSFVARALHGAPIEVYGDGLQVMDMVYVVDVARFLVDALTLTMLRGAQPTIEAGTGLHTTVLDVAQEVARLVPGARIEHLPMRPGESASRPVVADRGTQDILYPEGYKFMPLRTGIGHTVTYYRNKFV
jgi:UDP-glucose 4-epimerase